MGEAYLECICGERLAPRGISLLRLGEGSVELRCQNPFCDLRVIGHVERVNGTMELTLPKVLLEYNEVMYGIEELRRRTEEFKRAIVRLLTFTSKDEGAISMERGGRGTN